MKNRLQTRKVRVGPCEIGGSDHVYIQSMTNTPTKDVQATVQQIHNLEKAGCEIVRVACLDMKDAKAIKDIKSEIHIPLVADIHFDYRLALEAIKSGVDKVRINPGNIGSKEKVKAVVSACKEKGIPIRIGVNGGSLEKPLLEKYGGVCPEAMVESARNHVRILEELDFHDIIISLKASDPLMCVKAYELAAETFDYPLHIGITEAGTAFGGTIRSAIGLGILLHEGIGNTMRVSLSDDPVEEIRVAREILKNFHLIKDEANLISCPTCGRTQYDMIPIAKNIEAFLKDIHEPLTVAVMGCVVNGPGEARQADVGIAGGNKEGILFKKGQVVKTVPHEMMESELKKAILEMVKRP